MGITIKLKNSLSRVFGKLKSHHDKYVYDTKETAIPNFYEIVISGSGANVGEIVRITRNNDNIANVRSDQNGNFEVVVPVLYETSNFYQAYGSSSGGSNQIVFDIYNWLMFHYIFAEQFLEIYQHLAQSKQDINIRTKVGDDIQPLWITEKNSYDSSIQSLKDKMRLPIPTDYLKKNIQDAVEKAIEVSEKGPVYGSLQALTECYKQVGLEKIFVYDFNNPVYWNINTDCIPHVKSFNERNILVIPANLKTRIGWKYYHVTKQFSEKEIIFSEVKDKYIWVYVDGEKDVDDTLKVKVSDVQPVPGIYSTTLTFMEDEISIDIDGSVTGIPYQKYVNLVPPVASQSSNVSVEDAGGKYDFYSLVSREILALGRANAPSSSGDVLSVTYDYYLESSILCVLYFDNDGLIDKVMRIYATPGHVRAQTLEEMEVKAIINFKFGENVPIEHLSGVLNNINDILMEIVPITISFVPYVSVFLNDQSKVEEDSFYWPSIYKNYCLLSDLVSVLEIYHREDGRRKLQELKE